MNQRSLHRSLLSLELKIKESIETLGGAVFPKLNWSTPKDCMDSPSGTLHCTSSSETALCCDHRTHLSMICVMPMIHAVTKPFQQLVGISQRDATTFYPVLLEKNSDRQLLLGFL
uniref:Uncharacterized protein n=1 Tax=Populus trichocarpa TaxID=3694 RepID=A0A2K1ZX05_POPTR